MTNTITAQPVRTSESDLVAAFESALADVEPRFVPASIFVDDRGWSIMNQMQHVLSERGQINYSVMYPGVIKAWHRHQKQTDFWLCLQGHLKAGIYRDDGVTWQTIIGDRRPGVLVIPPPLWHGASNLSHEPSGLLYYVTEAYDVQNPDEERRAFDSVAGFDWGIQHK